MRVSLRVIVVSLVAIPVAGALVLFFYDLRGTFGVNAETEVLEGIMSPKGGATGGVLLWRLPTATVCSSQTEVPQRDEPVCTTKDGGIEINSPAQFQISRLETGPLKIRLESLKGAQEPFNVRFIPKNVTPSTPAVKLIPPVDIAVADVGALARQGQPITLPILARLTRVGSEPGWKSSSAEGVLRTGEVWLYGRSLIRDRTYVARKAELRYGEQVSFDAGRSVSPALSAGIVRIGESPAMRTSLLVEADSAEIRAPFSERRHERVTLLDRILGDPFFTAVWSLLAILFAAIGLYPLLRESK